jgi:hypothetical protein
VTVRPITVTANSETIPVGAPDPALTYEVTSGSLVNGDAFSGGLIRAPGEAVGSYPLLIGTLSAGTDYLLSYIGGNLSIVTSEQPATPLSSQFGTFPSSFISDNTPNSDDDGFGLDALGNGDSRFTLAYFATDPDASTCRAVGILQSLNRYNRVDLTSGNSASCKEGK